jgi:hypothetical protein
MRQLIIEQSKTAQDRSDLQSALDKEAEDRLGLGLRSRVEVGVGLGIISKKDRIYNLPLIKKEVRVRVRVRVRVSYNNINLF